MALKDAETKPLKTEQIRELSAAEMEQELTRLQEAQFRLTFRSATESLEKSSQVRALRRNIARLQTILQEKKRT